MELPAFVEPLREALTYPESRFRWLAPEERPDVLKALVQGFDSVPYDDAFLAEGRARLARSTPIALGPSRTTRLTRTEHTMVLMVDKAAPDRVFAALGAHLPPQLWPHAEPTRAGLTRDLEPYLARPFRPSPQLSHTVRVGRGTLEDLGVESIDELAAVIAECESWTDAGATWGSASLDDPWPEDSARASKATLRTRAAHAAQQHPERRRSLAFRTLWSRSVLVLEEWPGGWVVCELRYDPAPIMENAGGPKSLPDDLPADVRASFLGSGTLAPARLEALRKEGLTSEIALHTCLLAPAEPSTAEMLRAMMYAEEPELRDTGIELAAELGARGLLYELECEAADEAVRAHIAELTAIGPSEGGGNDEHPGAPGEDDTAGRVVILVQQEAVAREAVHRALVAAGFARTIDAPLTGTDRTSEWARGEARVAFTSELASGLGLFAIAGPDRVSLEGLVKGVVPCVSAADSVHADVVAERPGAQARAALRFGVLGRLAPQDASIPRPVMAEALARWLGSDRRAVCHAALEAALALEWTELSDAIAALSRTASELAWLGDHWGKARAAAQELAREAAAERAARDALVNVDTYVAEARWDDALRSAEKLMATSPPPVVALRARALALAGLGLRWEAALWASAWLVRAKSEEARAAMASNARDLPAEGTDLVGPVLEMRRVLKGGQDTVAALEALIALHPRRSEELRFYAGVIGVIDGLAADVRVTGRAWLKRTNLRCPDLVEGWLMFARSVGSADRAAAEAAYRKAIAAAAKGEALPPAHAPLARFVHALGEPVPTEASVWRSLRKLYAGDKEAIIRIATEQLTSPGMSREDRRWVRSERAFACTSTARHDDAIADYRAAIADGHPDEGGLLRFNLACELAKQGRKDEALPALAEAIARRASWSSAAREDAYFETLWDDRDFRALVSGQPAAPTREEVEAWTSRSLGHHFRGEGAEAVSMGERAVAGAERLDDPALLAKALVQLGTALTYHVKPQRGLSALERASALVAAGAFGGDAIEAARVSHAHAAALHAAGRHDDARPRYEEARARYQQALDLRRLAPGERTLEVAITLGDMARLASDRDDLVAAEALQQEVSDVLGRLLTTSGEDERHDVLANLTLNEANRAAVGWKLGRGAKVLLERAEATAGFVEALVAAGVSRPAQVVPRLAALVATLGDATDCDEETRSAALLMSSRLFALEESDPRVRAEMLYWASLRVGVRKLQAQGLDGPSIGRSLAQAVRRQPTSVSAASHPAFVDLALELAQRVRSGVDRSVPSSAIEEEVEVTVAMSLDQVSSGALSIEDAIDGLEELAMSNLEHDSELEDEGGA